MLKDLLKYGIGAAVILIIILWIFKCECGCWYDCGCAEGMCCCSHAGTLFLGEGFRVNRGRSATLYYTEWCPHCRAFRPEWEKIKQNLAATGIQLTEVNGDEKRDMSIKSYPTIVMIDEWGNRHQLVGRRQTEDVTRWLTAPIPDQFW